MCVCECRMRVCACRHLKRLERVLLSYLEVSDPPQESSRSSALEALETLLPVAWPRYYTTLHYTTLHYTTLHSLPVL